MTVDEIIEKLQARDLLKEAAEICEPAWEDDYSQAAVESGRKDYSILDFAADVVREWYADTGIQGELERLLR